MQVKKRNGDIVLYDINKIKTAIQKAYQEVYPDKPIDDVNQLVRLISTGVHSKLQNRYDDSVAIDIEQIQDIVEDMLMVVDKAVAKSYVRYRYKRELARNDYQDLMSEVKKKIEASDVQNQNANVDEKSFGGRIGEMSDMVMKRYALEYCVSPMARQNHLNNEVYIHDLSAYAVGNHNCLTIPFDDLLANGFNTRQTDVRAAQSVSTAFQLLAVIFQLQSLQQFGGVSASHIDWTMIPYVRKSFYKHYTDGLHYVESPKAGHEIKIALTKKESPKYSIDNTDIYHHKDAYKYAYDMTLKEIHQSVEGMYHNLNTLQSRSGNQLPFTSINYGTCTLTEGRMITQAILNVSIEGIGALHKTSVFPCGIFQCMKGVNRKPDEPNYDLFQLALLSTAKRLYPNYCNVDWTINEGYDKNDPRTYVSTMGKRKLWPM